MILPNLLSLALASVCLHPAAEPDAPVELALIGHHQLARVELRVEVDGTPITAVWAKTFARLFTFFDRNGDGVLDEKEAARLPSPLALRQAMGNGFTPPVGAAPPLDEIDGGDGKVTAEEMAAFYRGERVGTVLIGVGRLPGSATLTAALVESLDLDGNGEVNEEEWKEATGALKKLDANDDELIGAGELVPKLIYPGAAGTVLLTPPAGPPPPAMLGELPLLLLPADREDRRWADEVARRLPDFKDKGLAGWREREPEATWVIRHGDKPSAERFSFAGDGVRLIGWAVSGRMNDSLSTARLALSSMFEKSPAGPVGGGGRRRGGDLSWLTPIADCDADGTLDRKELDTWLDLQSQIARGQVLVTVLDGAGLFEILDTSHDGALSVRELRAAWTQLKDVGCVTAGSLDRARLPRVLLAAVSRGYPRELAFVERRGPAWSRAMDRNGDGDVSRREFTGPAAEFERLDRDGDGLLDADEAARAVADAGASKK